MALTQAFQSGDSQIVRIPAELAFKDMTVDLEVTRLGDMITITPARRQNLKAALRSLPKIPEVETHEPIEVPNREHE